MSPDFEHRTITTSKLLTALLESAFEFLNVFLKSEIRMNLEFAEKSKADSSEAASFTRLFVSNNIHRLQNAALLTYSIKNCLKIELGMKSNGSGRF